MKTWIATLAAALAVASIAKAQEDPFEAALTRLPARAPDVAFPGVPEITMSRVCRSVRRDQRFYPERAMERNVEGQVILDCVVGADGKMQTCQVLHEGPARLGFGDAAVRLACRFQVNAAFLEGGQPISTLPPDARAYRRNAEGEPWRVRVPIRFRIGA